MPAPRTRSRVLAVIALLVGATVSGCSDDGGSPLAASPSVSISASIGRPDGPGSLSGIELGCTTARPDQGYLRKVVASFEGSSGQAVFSLGPELSTVPAYDLYLGVQLPPDRFFETHFEVRDGTARLTAEPPPPVPPAAAVTEVSSTAVTVSLGPELLEFLENTDGFAVHGGVGVGRRVHECRKGTLSS